MSDALARAVRQAHLAYSDALVAAVRADVSAETLVSWGIPWGDIEKVLFAKGRLTGTPEGSACTCPRDAPPGPPSPPEWHCHGCGYWNPALGRDDRRTTTCRTCGAGRRMCSCGHGEHRHDDMYVAAALEGHRSCREVGCPCRTFVEYVKATSS